MQGGDFRRTFQMNIEQIMAIEDQAIYDQYKKESNRYQQIEVVEQLVDHQISQFPHQNDFRQQARKLYDCVSKHPSSSQLPKKQPLELSGDEKKDGIRYLFVFNKKKPQQQMVPQPQSQEMPIKQSNLQQKDIFVQIHTSQMFKHTRSLFERLQKGQIEAGEQKKLIPYLDSINLTIGILRKVLRDCIKTSLVYQHYVEQINQDCKHHDSCCQKQMAFISKIYQMQTQAMNKLFPEGKQSLLRQILAENYDLVVNKTQFLKSMKKIQKANQTS